MNFTIKYHKPAQACMCLMGKPTQNWTPSYDAVWYVNMTLASTNAFRDTIGNSLTGLANGWALNGKNSQSVSDNSGLALHHNRGIFWNLTAYASSEALSSFNENDYAVGGQVGTATQSYAYGYTNNTYSVSVRNSGESAIVVNSIKFTKPLYATSGSNSTSTCLMYSCYLDEEVTIPAGSEKVFVVNFSFINA